LILPMRQTLRLALPVATLTALAGCVFGPDYVRPEVVTPAVYKEIDGWKPAQPREAGSGISWWSIYDDPVLDGLERQIDISNQTLKENEAAYRNAVALVAEARAGYAPTVTGSASAARTSTPASSVGAHGGSSVGNSFSLSPSVSWVPDLWGRIRRTVENSVANAQASAADLAAARLTAQATLAADYLQIRTADELKRLLDDSIAAYQKTLDITRNQYSAGVAAETDVITALTQLQGTQAQEINVGVQRAVLEHAIAVLIGKPPAEFSIAPEKIRSSVPVVPTGLPSTLLERRPDIATVERAVAAANAEIGVAETAYFPDLTLTGAVAFTSTHLSNLLAASSAGWSIGAGLAGTIYNGGLFGAQVSAARATYDEAVATYRQTVLADFEQVEDELATLRILEQEAGVEEQAVLSSREAVRLTLNQYQAGTIAYTSVVIAQNVELADEEAALTILQNRLVASTTLIEALGGGWDDSQLPTPEAVGE
jgi:NodT family efflux transporter outer membrane factor (OMF) lipoprotein